MVEGVDDVLRALESLSPPAARERQGDLFAQARPAAPSESDLETARTIILENLGHTPVAIDELVRGCQLSAPVVLTVVLELELAGRVQRQPGNQVNLI